MTTRNPGVADQIGSGSLLSNITRGDSAAVIFQEEAERSRAREVDLRARWERLPEAEREAILAAVKAENPGLSRWRKMLEPLCLAEVERRYGPAKVEVQETLFREPDAAK